MPPLLQSFGLRKTVQKSSRNDESFWDATELWSSAALLTRALCKQPAAPKPRLGSTRHRTRNSSATRPSRLKQLTARPRPLLWRHCRACPAKLLAAVLAPWLVPCILPVGVVRHTWATRRECAGGPISEMTPAERQSKVPTPEWPVADPDARDQIKRPRPRARRLSPAFGFCSCFSSAPFCGPGRTRTAPGGKQPGLLAKNNCSWMREKGRLFSVARATLLPPLP